MAIAAAVGVRCGPSMLLLRVPPGPRRISNGNPWVDDRHSSLGEILHVARYDREIMLEGSSCDQTVCRGDRNALTFRPNGEPGPPVDNRLGYRQQTSCEPAWQTLIEPLLQPSSPLSGRQILDTEPDRSKGDNACEERLWLGGFEPAYYPRIRLGFDEL